MGEILNNAGLHSGAWGNGHYEARVESDGEVTIATIFDDPDKKGEPKVTLNRAEWERLAAWVTWAQTHPQK